MKVLLTGYGILSKHLLPLLKEDANVDEIVIVRHSEGGSYVECPVGDRIKFVGYDLSLHFWVDCLFSSFKPDVIFNFAATSTANSPAYTVWKNTNITLNLLEAIKDRPVQFIQASSIVIDNYPQTPYSVSKLVCEQLLESYKQLYKNISGFSFRTCAICGSGNNHGLLKDVIRKVLAEGNTVELFGNEPGSVKPYIYVKTLVNILYEIFKNKFIWNHTPFIISPRNSVSVKNVAEIVMGITGKKKETKWQPDKVWLADQPLVKCEQTSPFYGCHLLDSIDSIKVATAAILREEYGGK